MPPHYEFRFNKYFDTPDNEFFSYLADEKGIPDYEAIQLYNQFAQELRNSIKHDNKAEWNGIGVFTKNGSGDMIFEPANNPATLYAPVPAIKITHVKANHTALGSNQEKTTNEMTESLNEEIVETPVVKKERWWVYALILFIVALLIMIFHFYQNGFSLVAAANKQDVELGAAGSR